MFLPGTVLWPRNVSKFIFNIYVFYYMCIYFLNTMAETYENRFDLGCESTCTCEAGDVVTCAARCNLPLHPRLVTFFYFFYS